LILTLDEIVFDINLREEQLAGAKMVVFTEP